MKNLNYLMDYETVADNASIKTCVNKIENGIRLKIKTVCYLELLTPGTMKLLGSTNSKTTKDKNSENVHHLEITEVVFVHCNIFINSYQQDSKVLCAFVPNKSFGQLLDISPKKVYIFKNF